MQLLCSCSNREGDKQVITLSQCLGIVLLGNPEEEEKVHKLQSANHVICSYSSYVSLVSEETAGAVGHTSARLIIQHAD